MRGPFMRNCDHRTWYECMVGCIEGHCNCYWGLSQPLYLPDMRT